MMMMREWAHLRGARKLRGIVVAAVVADGRGCGDCAGRQHEKGYYP